MFLLMTVLLQRRMVSKRGEMFSESICFSPREKEERGREKNRECICNFATDFKIKMHSMTLDVDISFFGLGMKGTFLLRGHLLTGRSESHFLETTKITITQKIWDG